MKKSLFVLILAGFVGSLAAAELQSPQLEAGARPVQLVAAKHAKKHKKKRQRKRQHRHHRSAARHHRRASR